MVLVAGACTSQVRLVVLSNVNGGLISLELDREGAMHNIPQAQPERQMTSPKVPLRWTQEHLACCPGM